MASLSDRVSALRTLAARKGQTDIVPEWLGRSKVSLRWYDSAAIGGGTVTDHAAALIVTGSLAGWLHSQGLYLMPVYPFVPLEGRPLRWQLHSSVTALMHLETPSGKYLYGADHLSALFAAATAVLEAMPDKEPAHAD